MSYTAPVAAYSATLDGTYTALTGIQSVLINRGRQRFQDNFAPTSCVIELIPANSYALPLAVGQFIDVRDANTSTSPCYFAGVITDVVRRFDMPFNAGSGAAPGDRITITATGATGVLAANSVSNFPANSNLAFLDVFLTADRLGVGVLGNDVNATATPSSISFTGGAFDFVNALLRTEQFFIDDLDNRRLPFLINKPYDFLTVQFPPGQGNRNFVFSDTGTAGAFKFAALQYLSSVQNTFTEVEVVAPGIATQTASTGSAPFNTLVYNTHNANINDASNLAQFIIATQDLVAVTPFSVSTSTVLSPTCTTLSLLSNRTIFNVGDKGINLGSGVTVEFRGTTVEAQIQGINTTFYPDQARVQLYLSPSLGAQFILDNATFGVLDQNKLGF